MYHVAGETWHCNSLAPGRPSRWLQIGAKRLWKQTRNSQCPLELEIHGWRDGEMHGCLLAMLDILVSCAHRSLVEADVNWLQLEKSLQRSDVKRSLVHVSIENIASKAVVVIRAVVSPGLAHFG